jgi:hypothetical protein
MARSECSCGESSSRCVAQEGCFLRNVSRPQSCIDVGTCLVWEAKTYGADPTPWTHLDLEFGSIASGIDAAFTIVPAHGVFGIAGDLLKNAAVCPAERTF